MAPGSGGIRYRDSAVSDYTRGSTTADRFSGPARAHNMDNTQGRTVRRPTSSTTGAHPPPAANLPARSRPWPT
jgi:hypothetical protein